MRTRESWKMVVGLLVGLAANAAAAGEPFGVLDGTLFKDKPAGLRDRGFVQISIGYETSFDWIAGKRDWPTRPSVERIHA